MEGLLRSATLTTVCESARCPNIGECFGRRTATFMILGDVCTRGCGFCAVQGGRPRDLNPREPEAVAETAAKLGLAYVVITSVTRDDLPDGGADHFARTIDAVKGALPGACVEVLVPDFQGSEGALERLVEAGPHVLGHNLETVPRLYPVVRPAARYHRSLELLARAKALSPGSRTKSGLMLGLGEEESEVLEALGDLRSAGCDFATLGQYLQPASEKLPVAEYVRPEVFEELGRRARELGFEHVVSSPLARSSYHAEEAAPLLGTGGGG
jgi:lipoic acid synthetase